MSATGPDAATLRRMLNPAGIAILGASAAENSLPYRFVSGLQRHGYEGAVYPVCEAEEVLGLPAFAPGSELPGPCDCAVLAVPPAEMEAALCEAAALGAAGGIVFASGYREAGPEGAAAEVRLADLCAELGMALLGPNSAGFINAAANVCASASSVTFRERLLPGGLGVVAQGGGVAGIVVERAMDRGIGVSYLLATGNEAVVDSAAAVEFLAADESTTAIVHYQEGLQQGLRLERAWRAAAEAGKPVVLVTPHSSGAGARAAVAHTGSLVGDDDVLDAALREIGVWRAGDLDEAVEVAAALPRLRGGGSGVVVLTTSGGGSVLAADELGAVDVELPELDAAVQERLAAALPEGAATGNPVDMTSDFVGDPTILARAVEAVCRERGDNLPVLVVTVQRPEMATRIASLLEEVPELRAGEMAVLWYAGRMSREALDGLREKGIVVFEEPRMLAAAVLAARRWGARRSRQPLRAGGEGGGGRGAAPSHSGELFAALREHGVGVAPFAVAGPDELAAAARGVPAPWAVKSVGLESGRKSDRGEVAIGVADEAALAEAAAGIRAALGDPEAPLLVQAMAQGAFELLLSVRVDPLFGAVLVLGVGGRMTELLKRTACRRLPVEPGDVGEILAELDVAELLEGFRDVPSLDPAALAATANAAGEAAVALLGGPGILEVNPLLLTRDGELLAVDAKVEPAA